MKLSIITINFNNRDGLKKTIESVISQTFNDYEYIVIDGGSTDGSFDIINQYADKITYWVSEPDKGIYNAMNKGILQAKGEYCLFLNSGDWLIEENALQEVFKNSISEDVVYGNIFLYEDKSGKFIEKKYPEEIRFSYFLEESLPHPATFFKRRLFKEFGLYKEEYSIASDWMFFLLILCKFNCSYEHLPVAISVFNLQGVSSSNTLKIKKEKDDFLKQDFPLIRKDMEELLHNRMELSLIKNSRIYRLFLCMRKIFFKRTTI